MGRILTKGAMRLWRQRNSTAIQLYATMAHLPPEVLSTLPIIPHADARLSKEKFQSDQRQRDKAEELTPALLGILVQPPDPPEDSTEHSPLPQTEIQCMSSEITGIKIQEKLRRLKTLKVTSSSTGATSTVSTSTSTELTVTTSTTPTVITSTDYSNTAMAKLIL